MQEYSIGGQEVKGDASEVISDIPQNRTLMVEKLTAEAPVKPEMVNDLKNIDEVFEHFKPKVAVDFEDSEGGSREETLMFKGLSDFGVKGITAQSEFLKDLTNQKEQSLKIIKQLKSNKMLRKALENEETKAALLNAMYALIKEIEDTK
jgi:predicted component of type VI protein secretion system